MSDFKDDPDSVMVTISIPTLPYSLHNIPNIRLKSASACSSQGLKAICSWSHSLSPSSANWPLAAGFRLWAALFLYDASEEIHLPLTLISCLLTPFFVGLIWPRSFIFPPWLSHIVRWGVLYLAVLHVVKKAFAAFADIEEISEMTWREFSQRTHT